MTLATQLVFESDMILKNSKDLLEYIKCMSFSFCNTVKAFDNSTLYKTIPHSKLKDRLKELVQLSFLKKNDQRRYKYLVLGRNISYFVKKSSLILLKKNWYLQHARVFGLTTYLQYIYIPWPTRKNWESGTVKNETVRQKRLFQFFCCVLSIYM